EEYTPPVVEEYVPESQLTSDVDEAPAVQETKPTTKPPAKAQGKPVTEPQQKETPKETTKPGRKLNEKSLFGKDKTGSGKGGTSDKGGYKGSPDGKPDGSPNGTGGQGNMGDGTGSGPAIGPGIDGGIGGFKVKNYVKPQGGVQKSGVVSLRVCVDKNGNVKDVSKNPKFRVVEFDIMYGQGISKVGEVIDLGVENNVIQKSGSWFSYGETRLGQGRDSVKQLLLDNPEMMDEIEGKIFKIINGDEDEVAQAVAE
ncbi:hypothetical protein N9J89_02735, partial [Bacteroidia bacterium]|nr:hypothetical protein [Bacteroidia bacterium]